MTLQELQNIELIYKDDLKFVLRVKISSSCVSFDNEIFYKEEIVGTTDSIYSDVISNIKKINERQ